MSLSTVSFDETSKIFSGGHLPQTFDTNIPLGVHLRSQCLKFKDKIIEIFAEDGAKVTYGELYAESEKVACYLQQSLRFGDVVGFCGRNSKHSTPAIFGCILAGLPVSPVEFPFEAKSFNHIFKRTRPKLLLCDVEVLEQIRKVSTVLDPRTTIVTLNGKVNDYLSIENILEEFSTSNFSPSTFSMRPEKICLAILPTSGSTGDPKPARITHAQGLQSLYAFNAVDDDGLVLNFDELFGVAGFCCIIHCVLNQQARLIPKETFSPPNFVALVENFKVSQLQLSPTRIKEIIEYLNEHPGDLSSVKTISTGAWFITEETIEQIESKMPNGRVEIQYGMTESAGIVSRSSRLDPTSSSVGKIRPSIKAKILLENGALGGLNDVGEILLKVPFNILDYLGDEDSTRALFYEDFWIRTGDVGWFDENLNLFVAARKKFMVRSPNGLISPVLIEEAIAKLEGVKNVCVTKIPTFDDYEVPCAIVERRENSAITEEEIQRATKHLDEASRLKGGVFFVEKLPKTPTGKVNRHIIEKIALKIAQNA